MKFFDKEINFELGPSIGFKSSPGCIQTCDLIQYMSVNGVWYRIDVSEKEIINSFEKCKSILEFQEVLDKLNISQV